MSSFDPSHLCSSGWTVQSRNASWFRMKLGGWLYCLQNQNIRVLSMFFSHPTKERGRKSNHGCTPQIWGAYFLKVKVLVAQLCSTLQPHGQAPRSMGFTRQEYWNVLPFPSPGDISDPGRDRTCVSCTSCTAGRFFTTEPSRKPQKGSEINVLFNLYQHQLLFNLRIKCRCH